MHLTEARRDEEAAGERMPGQVARDERLAAELGREGPERRPVEIRGVLDTPALGEPQVLKACADHHEQGKAREENGAYEMRHQQHVGEGEDGETREEGL